MKSATYCLKLAAVLLTAALSISVQAASRHALLIGINDYDALPRLQGAENDVAAVQALLTTRFGFAEDNITVITNRAATRAGILRAFADLARRTGPADTVYVHYSGHGSQVQDLNGDEQDGLDETIAPQDARLPGIPDITDDELDRALAAVRSRHLIVTLDSCHSGTGLRGGASRVRPRFVPMDTRVELYRANQVTTRAVVPLNQSESYILFTGAADFQSALDGPFDRGRYHGLFTYAYLRAMDTLQPTATPEQIIAAVEKSMQGMRGQLGGYLPPEPQLEGPPTRLAEPLIEASGSGDDKQIRRRGNAAGSIWLAPVAGATGLMFELQHVGANAPIERLNATEIASNMQGSEEPIALQRAPALAAVNLSVSTIPDAWSASLVATLGRAMQGRVQRTDSDHRLDCRQAGDYICTLTLEGQEVATLKDRSIEGLGDRIAEQYLWPLLIRDELEALHNLTTAQQLEMTIPGSPPTVTRGIRAVPVKRPRQFHFYREGEVRSLNNSLQLDIRADQTGYVTVFEVDALGQVSQLFPNAVQNSNFIPAGNIEAHQTVRIPDRLSADNMAGFTLDFGPPAGDDLVVAIHTSSETLTNLLRGHLFQLSELQQPDQRYRTAQALRREMALATARGEAWQSATLKLHVQP